ncbi:MAG: glycosyltransferase family 2 protein [Parcubacteria group bacterium]
MNVCIIIPAYNESVRIKSVLREISRTGFDVIVVDDGSSDDTARAASEFPVKLLEHAVNLGQGAALKTGTELAHQLGYEIIVHFDGDGQHRVEDIVSLVEILKNEDVDVALGSRFMGLESNYSLKKKIILNLAKIFSKKFLQLNFTDPQSGLRAFKSRVLPQLNWTADDFLHASEILNLIIKNKLKYKEIPIQVNYDEHTSNKKVKPRMNMGWKMLIGKIFR